MATTATPFVPWHAAGALTVPQPAASPARLDSLENFLRTVSQVVAAPQADAVDTVKRYGVDRADIANLYGGGESDTQPILGGLRDLSPPSSSTRSVTGSRVGDTASMVGGGAVAGPVADAPGANGGRLARVSSDRDVERAHRQRRAARSTAKGDQGGRGVVITAGRGERTRGV